MVYTTGMDESEVISEVERYMAAPGQACAYKVGELKILELREKRQGRPRTEFDSGTSTRWCWKTGACHSRSWSSSWMSGSPRCAATEGARRSTTT